MTKNLEHPAPREHWYYLVGDSHFGPVTRDFLQSSFNDGSLDGGSTFVWREGLSTWVKADACTFLRTGQSAAEVRSGPPPLPISATPPQIEAAVDAKPPVATPPFAGPPPLEARSTRQAELHAPQNPSGISDEDYRLLIGERSDRYLAKWQMFNTGRRRSWNWAAWLLGPGWMIYRKMYLFAALAFGIMILEVILGTALGIPSALSSALNLAASLVFGFYGDYWYKLHADRVTLKIHAKHRDTQKQRDALVRAGGTSVMAFLCLVMIVAFLSVALLLAAAMGDGQQAPVGQEQSVPVTQQPTPEQLAASLKTTVVKIEGAFEGEGWLFNDRRAWSGTGVIIEKKDGYYVILSNCHVLGFWSIYESTFSGVPKVLRYTLNVTLPDGKSVGPSAVMINSRLKDYCLIYVGASAGKYNTLPLSNVATRQGQKVYAMGHPLGLDYTFTSGVISGYRQMNSALGTPYLFIQTDTSINPGNSGGALVDAFGNLVGLNTSKFRGGENLNFAIASTEILQDFDKQEFVNFPLTPSKLGPFIVRLQKGR